MTDSTLNKFIAAGTAADRAAFTPSPPTPAAGAAQGYFWHETDTGDTYSWKAGTGWIKVNTGSAGAGTSTSLSQISSSLSGAISSTTSLSSAVSTVDSNQSTSLSQISSSLSGGISSTTSLSTAVSTVDSNQSTSISINLSKINSLSTAVGAGAAWTQILASTSIPNPSATYDISGLSGYSEILIIGRNIPASSAGFRIVQAGKSGTFYSTSGDYKGVAVATGIESNASDWGGNGSSTASATTIVTHIMNNITGGVPVSYQAAVVPILFVAVAAPIDSARLKNTAGNLTGGTVEVWGRP